MTLAPATRDATAAPSRMAVTAVEAAVRSVGGPIALTDRAALAHFGRILQAAYTAGFTELAVAQACSVWASQDLIEAANAELEFGEPLSLAPFHRVLTRSVRATAHIARAEALRTRQGELDIRIFAVRLTSAVAHVNAVAALPDSTINPISQQEARRTFMDGMADGRARTFLATRRLHPNAPLKDLAEDAHVFLADTTPPSAPDDAASAAKVRSLEGELRALRLKLKDKDAAAAPTRGEYAARESLPQALPLAASTGGWEARTCYNCGQRGHPAHDCAAPRDEARVSKAFQARKGPVPSAAMVVAGGGVAPGRPAGPSGTPGGARGPTPAPGPPGSPAAPAEPTRGSPGPLAGSAGRPPAAGGGASGSGAWTVAEPASAPLSASNAFRRPAARAGPDTDAVPGSGTLAFTTILLITAVAALVTGPTAWPSFPPQTAQANIPAWAAPGDAGVFANVAIDTGTTLTWMSPEVERVMRARGLTLGNRSADTAVAIQPPHFPEQEVRGHWQTVMMHARNGTSRLISAFVAPFFGSFQQYGIILAGTNATALGLHGSTTPPDGPTAPHAAPDGSGPRGPGDATPPPAEPGQGDPAPRDRPGWVGRAGAHLRGMLAAALSRGSPARTLPVWLEPDGAAEAREAGHSGLGRWATEHGRAEGLDGQPSHGSFGHGPTAGATRPLADSAGRKLAAINSFYTAENTAAWADCQVLEAELVVALAEGADRPLIRSKAAPVVTKRAAGSTADLFVGRSFAMSAAHEAVMDKFVAKSIANGTIEAVPMTDGVLARPPGVNVGLVNMFITPEELRPVADMRALNRATNTSSMRHTPSLAAQVAHAAASACFFITDCSKAFYSVRTSTDADESIVTCFRHRGLLYRFRVLVMGGVLSPGLFCARMEAFCTSRLGHRARSYVDDVVAHLPEPVLTPDGYDIRPALREAIRIAREFASDDGFRLNPDKTVILAGKAVCCGRVAGSGSVSLAPESTRSVMQLEAPTSGKDCARIAGVLNAVAPCVPGLGAVAGRIAQASRRGAFRAMTPAEHDRLERDVAEAAHLVAAAQEVWAPTRAPGTRLVLFHDASRDGFGWKLAEFRWPGPGPIPDTLPEGAIPADDDPRLATVALGSRATKGREKMYAAVDLELGGARVAYRACAALLGGSDRFVMVTDSRPWVVAFAADKVKPKFLRIILEITAGANVQVAHCAGAIGNPLTDALSRSFHGRRATLADCLPEYTRPAPTPGTRLLEAGFGIRWPEPLAATTTRAAAALRDAGNAGPPGDLGAIALDDDDSEDDTAGADSPSDADSGSGTSPGSDSGWDGDVAEGSEPAWEEDEIDDGEGTDGEGEDPVAVAAPVAMGIPGLGLLPRDTASVVRRLPALRTTGEPLPAALHPDPTRRYFAGRGRQDPGPLFRGPLVAYYHARGHIGTQAVRHAILAGGNDWPGMPEAVRTHCAMCPSCQVWNVHAPAVNPYPVDIYADVAPGAHLCMDVTHMTTSPDGYKMILCVMCVATRYKFAIPLRSENTEEICAALDLVLGINGPTARLSCDNNVVFTGAAVAAVAARHGAAVDTTSEYSKANRCELACKAIGDAVRKSATSAGSPLRWRVLLAQVVSDLNAAVTRIGSLGAWISPFEAYMARCNRLALPTALPGNPDLLPDDHVALRRRLDLIYGNDVVNVARAQAYSGTMALRRARYESSRVVTVFPPGTLVLVHRHERAPKWRRRWEGPYAVLHRSRGGAYTLLNRDNKVLARRFIPQLLKRWRGPIEHAPGEDELWGVLQDRLRPDGSPEYLCSWVGYGSDQNTWEGTSSFDDLDFLTAYHSSKTRPFLASAWSPSSRG